MTNKQRFEKAKRASIKKWEEGNRFNFYGGCGFCWGYYCRDCPIMKIESQHCLKSILREVNNCFGSQFSSSNEDEDLKNIAILLYLHSLEYEERFAV